MLGCSCTLFNKKETFNTKYPQLHVAKDFAVAEKKLHLAVSGRKYDPGKKAPKRKCTSDVKTADPKPSTSQEHHKMNPPLNSSHKMSLPLNSNHKMNLSLNSSHRMSPSLNSNKLRLQLNSHRTKLLIH